MLFKPSRKDGRTDAQVVFDLARDKSKGTTIPYVTLTAALQEGLALVVDRSRVYQAVKAGNRLLLKDAKRYLRVIRGEGYRIIFANEHLPTALVHRDRAETMLRKGLSIMRNTNRSELTANERMLHEGQLMTLAVVHQSMRESRERHAEHDAAILDLKKRVEKIEQTV